MAGGGIGWGVVGGCEGCGGKVLEPTLLPSLQISRVIRFLGSQELHRIFNCAGGQPPKSPSLLFKGQLCFLSSLNAD